MAESDRVFAGSIPKRATGTSAPQCRNRRRHPLALGGDAWTVFKD